MTKYSTGSSGESDGGESCELCGAVTDELVTVSIAGADLSVCSTCRQHDENFEEASASGPSPGQKTRTAGYDQGNQEPSTSPLWDSDTTKWEREGANYDSDQLPYLVDGYGELVQEERVAMGFTLEELADELEASRKELFAVEQGNAATMGVSGSVIHRLEEYLGVSLVKQVD